MKPTQYLQSFSANFAVSAYQMLLTLLSVLFCDWRGTYIIFTIINKSNMQDVD